MIKSLNTKVEYVVEATAFLGVVSYGKMMVGDVALEYYNSNNLNDYIQIPWSEIEYISASVIFNRKINRFAIFTKRNGHFTFSTRNNKKTLKTISEYIGMDKLYRSDSFFKVIKKGILRLFRKG